MKIVNHSGTWYLMEQKTNEITFTPLDETRTYEIKKQTKDTRSVLQNSSMHMYFSLVSESLNDAGFTLQEVVAKFKKADIEWTMISVKDIIWRNIQIATLDKESTATLTPDEVAKVYKYVDYYMTTKIGTEHIPFPSQGSLMEQQKEKENHGRINKRTTNS